MQLEFPAWPPRWPEIDAAVEDSLRSGDWGRYQSDAHRQLRKRLAELFRPQTDGASTPAAGIIPAGERMSAGEKAENDPFPADVPPANEPVPTSHVDRGLPGPAGAPEQTAPTHVRLCCSGTAAIELALRAAGVGPGDEVIVAAYDYPGNFRCIELVGARPVLVDVVPGGVTLDPAGLDVAAGERVKAVIVSHLYGQPASWETIAEICKRNGWVTIEDACQVPGMTIMGGPPGSPNSLGSQPLGSQPLGSLGDVAAISFGGSKLLTAGSGGALLTRDPRIASRLNAWIDRPSDSYPLSPLQAAVLLPQIERLAEWNRRRHETVKFLQRHWRERFPQWTPVGPGQIGAGQIGAGQSGQMSGRMDATSERDLTSERDSLGPQESAFYKFAWFTRTSDQRRRLIDKASRDGIPIGEGFRSSHRSSQRRCRRPSPLDHAAGAGERICVLDHRALMLPANRREQLLDVLTGLYAQAQST